MILGDKIKELNGVADVEYITKDQALAEYRNSLGDDGAYLEGYDGEDHRQHGRGAGSEDHGQLGGLPEGRSQIRAGRPGLQTGVLR